ncbi:hypothetical protein CSOJ01_10863 [Colletotrichum sojae]|uniref:Uncharacterized protein n=1 Tax=Colletotrichum sojae TaxID=2175907 RepID=A0A8H6IZ03_9PEZI|nr:hypothetical protein CSOJ01_10863 [Colletotrichum sojae]
MQVHRGRPARILVVTDQGSLMWYRSGEVGMDSGRVRSSPPPPSSSSLRAAAVPSFPPVIPTYGYLPGTYDVAVIVAAAERYLAHLTFVLSVGMGICRPDVGCLMLQLDGTVVTGTAFGDSVPTFQTEAAATASSMSNSPCTVRRYTAVPMSAQGYILLAQLHSSFGLNGSSDPLLSISPVSPPLYQLAGLLGWQRKLVTFSTSPSPSLQPEPASAAACIPPALPDARQNAPGRIRVFATESRRITVPPVAGMRHTVITLYLSPHVKTTPAKGAKHAAVCRRQHQTRATGSSRFAGRTASCQAFNVESHHPAEPWRNLFVPLPAIRRPLAANDEVSMIPYLGTSEFAPTIAGHRRCLPPAPYLQRTLRM